MTEDFDRLRASLSDRYRIERELDQGGMATVYLAEDLKHQRQVAIKVMRPEIAVALGGERFLREIAIAGRLQHPNILMMLDSGELDDLLYYVMPYVEGESLAERLEREAQLPIEEALQITREVASALGYAHAQGVIHRDIQPDNIMLSGGHAVVMDFGIGKALEAEAEKLTQAGMSVGTPTYMSPEQASGEREVDSRSDVYALGSVLYHMLVGEPPYTGATPQAIHAKRMSDAIPSARRIRETIPPEVDAAIQKSLARDPGDRYSTAEGFAAAVAPEAPASAAPAVLDKRKRPPRSTLLVGLAAGVLLVVAAIIGVKSTGSAGAPGGITLAVLPFENRGPADDEYFAEGMTEEVSDRLARISGLSVMPPTSAARFEDTEMSPGEIGDELGVEYLLLGSVRWAKAADGTSRVRVTPRLVRVSDESQVWSEPYDGDFTDVFELQADLATKVAEALDVRLLRGEERAIQRAPTISEAAWEQYSFGRYYHARTEGARAVEHYKAAIELDPDFALAYAGLADAYHHAIGRASQGGRLAEKMDDWARAEQAARRALALDSTLGPAYVSLGYLQMSRDLDWERAETNILRGLALDPDYAQGRSRHAFLLMATGRTDSALAEARRAVELDPLSPKYANTLAQALLLARRFEELEEAVDRVLALDSTWLGAYTLKVNVPILREDWPAVAADVRRAGLPPELTDLWVAAILDRQRVPEFLAYMEPRSAMVVALPMTFALGFTLIGEHDRAITTLERGIKDRSFSAITLVKSHWLLDPLRGEPRFQALLDSMRLE